MGMKADKVQWNRETNARDTDVDQHKEDQRKFSWTSEPSTNDSKTENEFLDEISNELHEYYRAKQIENYTSRILKMVKIVWAMKRIHEDDACGNFVKK
ncbi:hypothetical protein B9Z55_020916 [Caenorhabditis nigoni]|uniref:NR LBD domain-containing protein n=1 Tax=Caenorhabditis nigoni TaxID=1611254 RepID=A0A2G5TPR4_9PELO|nr:hypothetical protein B9Z55_020916 [Caenorhabditis nigoni]